MSELPLDQVRTLLAVVDEGTFDSAATALRLTPSAVSQRVKALEQRTGRVLLMRTKPVRPTESGEVVALARQLARLEHEAQAALGMSGPGEPTLLPIAVNSDSLATWSWQPCGACRRSWDSATTAPGGPGPYGRPAAGGAGDGRGDLVAGGGDGLFGPAAGRMRYLPVASPGFADRWLGRRDGTALRELIGEAPVVCFDRRDDLQDAFVRRLGPGARPSARRHLVPTSEGFANAVASGMGWGMVPEVQAEPLLSDGRLVRLAPEPTVDVPLYWQQWKLESPALAAVAEAVAAEAAEALDEAPPN
uniref:HTH-type transcriptional regulator LysG n=1 Tax=Streptomyces griseus TaxID=1911 RepID=O87968_STRGR|nr:Orf5 [Streptomyces griseus]